MKIQNLVVNHESRPVKSNSDIYILCIYICYNIFAVIIIASYIFSFLGLFPIGVFIYGIIYLVGTQNFPKTFLAAWYAHVCRG